MKSLRVLIVEDELIIAESHRDKLLSFGLEQVDICDTVLKAKDYLDTTQPGLVLLDVRLEDHFEGIELGEFISVNYGIPIAYLTAHSDLDTIQQMVRTRPVGYLSKPVRKPDLFAVVLSVSLQRKEKPANRQVVLHDGQTSHKIELDDILYAQSQGNYINILLSEARKRVVVRMTMEQLILKLNSEGFFRVSRSYLVNLHHVKRFDRRSLWMNDLEISIAKTSYGEFEERINKVHN